METDFTEDSVLHGLVFDQFLDTPEDIRNTFITLLSRISESSYRRGLQHGAAGVNHEYADDIRHNWPLSKSPHDSRVISSIDMLKRQYGCHLSQVDLISWE